MADEISLKFNSLDLSDGTYYISGFKFKAKSKIAEHSIPKSNITILEDARLDALDISVDGTVIGTGYDSLRTNLDALKAALRNGEQKLTMDDDRYIMARLKDFDYSFVVMQRMANWSANFICGFPFWVAESATSDTTTPTSCVDYTITNSGNAYARCKVEITAVSQITDDCSFSNSTTGVGFKYRGTTAAGKTLEVDNQYDTMDLQVLNNGTDDHTNFEGDFIMLAPGDNSVRFTGTAGTSVKVTWRDTWEA
jgi:phage-related protein